MKFLLAPAIVSAALGIASCQTPCSELDAWSDTPRGRLAAIIVLDQFTRHVFRHRPEAFAGDERARRLCHDGIEAGELDVLRPCERLFLLGPLEHSESLADQQLARSLWSAQLDELDWDSGERLAYYVYWIDVHRELIERFGRFPHRNRILGRVSTDDERAYLADDPPDFGQR